MHHTVPPQQLPRSDWVRRCAARIREVDVVVTLIDAADLASALYELPCCHDLEPEAAAVRLFQDNLKAPPLDALASLCEPRKAPSEDRDSTEGCL
jgi:hypothetical protein